MARVLTARRLLRLLYSHILPPPPPNYPPQTLPTHHPQSFVTGPKFCGVKMMPPGVHFVAYAATGAAKQPVQGGTADTPQPPTSSGVAAWFWLDAAPASVTVRRWCAATELLLPLADDDEAERYAAGVRRFVFDAGLAPYNLGGLAIWKQLTPHVTSRTITRIMAGLANASVAAEADPGAGRPPTAAEAALDAALAAGRAAGASSSAPADPPTSTSTTAVGPPTFTHFPRVAPSARGAPPSAATAANVDKSGHLAAIIASCYRGDGDALLGELEAAFIAAWAGHSLSALACWGDGVRLLLGCTDAVVGDYAPFFASALAMLRAQLGVSLGDGGSCGDSPAAPTVIDADALFEDAFLKRALRGFYEGLAEAGGGPPEVQVSRVEGGRGRAQPTNADNKSSLLPPYHTLSVPPTRCAACLPTAWAGAWTWRRWMLAAAGVTTTATGRSWWRTPSAGGEGFER